MKKYIVLLAFPLLIAGCIDYTQNMYLNKDGSGTMGVYYSTKAVSLEGLDSAMVIPFFNEDSLSERFSSRFYTIDKLNVRQDSSDTTLHVQFEISFKSIDSLDETLLFETLKMHIEDAAAGQKLFSQQIDPVAVGFGVDTMNVRFRYEYQFPGDIVTHNAHLENGNTLKWTYKAGNIGGTKAISVTYRPIKLDRTPMWIYILSASVLLLVLIFLFRKKR